MEKSINAWCFSKGKSLEDMCILAKKSGFKFIELNMSEKIPNDNIVKDLGLVEGQYLTLDMDEEDFKKIFHIVKSYNLTISGISTSLLWNNSLTDNDENIRERGKYIVKKMIKAASFLECDSILLVPGLVTKDVSYDLAYKRAKDALLYLKKFAEDAKVNIGIENVWNKFLLSPLELRDFVDSIGSEYVKVYFDAGNVLQFGFPEQWIYILGNRICRVHVKDFDKTIGNIHGFKNLLQGDMDFSALMKSLKDVSYDGFITAELSPYNTNPDQLIYDTSKALDYILNL